jgi:hypothetical protein
VSLPAAERDCAELFRRLAALTARVERLEAHRHDYTGRNVLGVLTEYETSLPRGIEDL